MSSRGEIDRLRSELDELFAEAAGTPPAPARRQFQPAVDCFRTANPAELVVVVELAGVDPGTVELTAAERTLVVAGERRRLRTGQGGQIYEQMEIGYGPFERRIRLPDDVDAEGAAATYELGLLKVVFPIVTGRARSTRVPIDVQQS